MMPNMPSYAQSQQGPQQPGIQQPAAPGPAAPLPGAGQAPDPGADFSDLDPMMLKRLADLYGIPMEEAAQLMRMKRSEMLAQTETPKGRQVGDVFVASNPLEMAASAMKQGMGMRGMKDIADARSQLGQRGVQDYEGAYGLYGGKGLGF